MVANSLIKQGFFEYGSCRVLLRTSHYINLMRTRGIHNTELQPITINLDTKLHTQLEAIGYKATKLLPRMPYQKVGCSNDEQGVT